MKTLRAIRTIAFIAASCLPGFFIQVAIDGRDAPPLCSESYDISICVNDMSDPRYRAAFHEDVESAMLLIGAIGFITFLGAQVLIDTKSPPFVPDQTPSIS